MSVGDPRWAFPSLQSFDQGGTIETGGRARAVVMFGGLGKREKRRRRRTIENRTFAQLGSDALLGLFSR